MLGGKKKLGRHRTFEHRVSEKRFATVCFFVFSIKIQDRNTYAGRQMGVSRNIRYEHDGGGVRHHDRTAPDGPGVVYNIRIKKLQYYVSCQDDNPRASPSSSPPSSSTNCNRTRRKLAIPVCMPCNNNNNIPRLLSRVQKHFPRA